MAHVEPSTLRQTVNRNGTFAQRFDEAEKLLKGLCSSPDVSFLPFFTPHGKSHSEAAERYLNEIIWGARNTSEQDFIPTPEEAMYLLSAVWLHDIGMMYGIFESEVASEFLDIRRVMG